MTHDWNAFIESLYHAEYERLFSVAYHKTKSRELAEDLVQETFLLAIFNDSKLAKHPKPGAWLMQTLCNLISNELRSSSRKDVPLNEAAELPARAEEDSLDHLLPVQLQAKEREILLWRFERQVSYQEMAERLGISEALCRKRVSQAVIKCRKFLQE